uniref:Uncharacterized protein n=1 Tax=Peronospora matthiolae TaxID=2874970 RepID=A0AAV1UTD7_9STRA
MQQQEEQLYACVRPRKVPLTPKQQEIFRLLSWILHVVSHQVRQVHPLRLQRVPQIVFQMSLR